MKLRSLNWIVLSAFLMLNTTVAQNSDEQTNFVKKIYKSSLTQGETYGLLKQLCQKFPKRLSGSPGAAGAIEWTRKIMHDYGFDHVYLQDVMVPHWVRGAKEQATIISGESPVSLNILALGRSIATPEKGVTAQVVSVESLDKVAELGRDKIAGKIVFYDRPFAQEFVSTFRGYVATVGQRTKGASLAAKYGAVAVVIRSVGTGDDDFPHTGSLHYDKETPKIPAAALSAHAADALAAQLAKNPELKLFLKLNCQNLPEVKSHNVIGEIRGSENPDQIIMVSGHLDAWDPGEGAHDDGAGTMQSISALRTLLKLGYKPKNTLRAVMFINEENGLRGGRKYAELAVQNKEQHIIAIESDAGGFTPREFGIKGADSSLAKMRSWLGYFPENTIATIKSGHGGADIGPLNRADGTPVCGFIPDSQRYFDFHHSPADVFSAVNRRELELGTASLATLVYLVDQFGL